MCLHRVSRKSYIGERPIMTEDTGYKVFMIPRIPYNSGRLYGMYYPPLNAAHYTYNKEYVAINKPQYIQEAGNPTLKYQAGFHYFPKLEDAIRYMKGPYEDMQTFKVVVRKVHVKNVVAEGSQYDIGEPERKLLTRVATVMTIEEGEVG